MGNSRPLKRAQTVRFPETFEPMEAERRRNLPASRDPKWDEYRLAARTFGARRFAGRARRNVVEAEKDRQAADTLERSGKLRGNK